MEIKLTIEDAIECFGRAKIEQWINNGMQFEHKYQLRTMLGRETLRNMSYDEQHETMKLNVRVGEPPKRKKIKYKNLIQLTKKIEDYTKNYNPAKPRPAYETLEEVARAFCVRPDSMR